MSDPQFSYGGIIWKAIGALLTKIVTAPFRALGAMLGLSGEKLEAIEFDPRQRAAAAAEREKLQQVGTILAKRAQLKVTVPGGYHEAADSAALRAAAVRAEIARRAGIKLAPGEAPGPLDLADRSVREAIRELFAAASATPRWTRRARRPKRRPRPALRPVARRRIAAGVAARHQVRAGRAAGGRRAGLLPRPAAAAGAGADAARRCPAATGHPARAGHGEARSPEPASTPAASRPPPLPRWRAR